MKGSDDTGKMRRTGNTIILGKQRDAKRLLSSCAEQRSKRKRSYPKSITSYDDEGGRGGRDDDPSTVTGLHLESVHLVLANYGQRILVPVRNQA